MRLTAWCDDDQALSVGFFSGSVGPSVDVLDGVGTEVLAVRVLDRFGRSEPCAGGVAEPWLDFKIHHPFKGWRPLGAGRAHSSENMPDHVLDLTIIGGGPTGLFGAFYAGLRGLSTRIIDSLPELGGQLMALYPEKYVFDVGGIPKILAKDLARDMISQGTQFDPHVILDEEVHELRSASNHFVLRCRGDEYASRSVLIAGGKGAFEPRHLQCPGYGDLLGKGIYYAVKNPDDYVGKRILIVGGGDSALDWALSLKDRASHLTIAHRRDGFRAHEASVQLLEAAKDAGEIDVRTFHEVRRFRGDGHVESATLFDNRTNEDFHLDVDVVLCFLGFKPDLGPIKTWGLELDKNRIVVSQLMETSIPGIYAAGDLVSYPGKLDLIATGYAEAAIAVNNAASYLDPEARVNPGHSTNLAIFKDK